MTNQAIMDERMEDQMGESRVHRVKEAKIISRKAGDGEEGG